jgi:RNA polymerase sigma factor (sigma-70 family)
MSTIPQGTDAQIVPHPLLAQDPGEGATDSQLLERFIAWRDEAAFAALVGRHGPMVLGVCRRILRSECDAEDAFQATFLVLVRRAASIKSKALLVNFLYGVAIKTALRAKAMRTKRLVKERAAAPRTQTEIAPETEDRLLALLDQELAVLPDIYRAAIVLCDLEGKSIKTAAGELGCPQGTVGTRLARGRNLLSQRLARQGFVISGGLMATAIAQNTATAGVPPLLAATTVKGATFVAAGQAPAPGMISVNATALAEGVLKTTLLAKLKFTTVVLTALTVVGTGTVALLHQGQADKPTDQPVTQTPEPAVPPQKQKVEPAAPLVTQKPAPANQPIREKKQGEIEVTELRGVVKTVDAEKGTLTVADSEGEKTFTVAKEAKIQIDDGKPGELAELLTGTHVALSKFVDQKTPHSIVAHGPLFWGALLKAVDADKNTVTFEEIDKMSDVAKIPELAGKTYPVAKGANIVIDGKTWSRLVDLPSGANVDLALSVDQKAVRRIEARGAQVDGEVKAVFAEKNTIIIAINVELEKTFSVAKDATIEIDGKPARLAAIPTGVNVTVSLGVDHKTVRSIQVKGP